MLILTGNIWLASVYIISKASVVLVRHICCRLLWVEIGRGCTFIVFDLHFVIMCSALLHSGRLSLFNQGNKHIPAVFVSHGVLFLQSRRKHLFFCFLLGGKYKESHGVTVLNRKHVWGVCKSRRSSSALQLQGDEQGLKMYHSDARQHYK